MEAIYKYMHVQNMKPSVGVSVMVGTKNSTTSQRCFQQFFQQLLKIALFSFQETFLRECNEDCCSKRSTTCNFHRIELLDNNIKTYPLVLYLLYLFLDVVFSFQASLYVSCYTLLSCS